MEKENVIDSLIYSTGSKQANQSGKLLSIWIKVKSWIADIVWDG
jgi:hypothetical protein